MARNLAALLPLALEYGPNRIAFCTDDRDPDDIFDNGHINGMVREAVADGRDAGGRAPDGVVPPRAVARAHAPRRGRARLPGRPARCCPTSSASCPTSCSSAGGRSRIVPSVAVPEWVRQTVRIKPVTAADFAIPSDGSPIRAIGLIEDQVVTRVARTRSGRRRGPRRRGRRCRPRQDRGRRAPPRQPGGSGSGSSPARDSDAERSPRRSRTTRTTSSSSG